MPTKVKILVKKSDGPARKRARLECTDQVVGVKGDVRGGHGATETLSREGCVDDAKNGPEPNQKIPNIANEEALVRYSLIQDLKDEMSRRHARKELIQELEGEMSRRRANEVLLESGLEESNNRETCATVNHPFAQGGLSAVPPPIANRVVTGGLCETDGKKRKQYRYTCTHDGCTNQAKKGGVCTTHGAKRKTCNRDGCSNQALKGGVCWRHGAKVTLTKKAKRKTCSHEGCTNQAKKRGLCCRHGAYKKNKLSV